MCSYIRWIDLIDGLLLHSSNNSSGLLKVTKSTKQNGGHLTEQPAAAWWVASTKPPHAEPRRRNRTISYRCYLNVIILYLQPNTSFFHLSRRGKETTDRSNHRLSSYPLISYAPYAETIKVIIFSCTRATAAKKKLRLFAAALWMYSKSYSYLLPLGCIVCTIPNSIMWPRDCYGFV